MRCTRRASQKIRAILIANSGPALFGREVMKKFFLALLLATAAVAAPEKWKEAIDKFTQADAVTPPPHDAVLFIGSSSIVKWTSLAKDFPDVKVINRGFGGSELADSVAYLDRIAIPYHPRVVVVYAGDNDLNAGKSPEAVASNFAAFCAKIHAALPQTRIVFIGIKPSPSRWKIHEKMEQANALIAAQCAQDKRRVFVDVWKPMLDAKGEPRPELFQPDMLHMKPEGYAIWTPLVAPTLKP
jgi:lysophospholipase L1-like esterase